MKNNEGLLRDGCRTLGIPCTELQIQAFLLYLAELKKWNRACNLTGLKTDRDIIQKHFLDSLLYLSVLPGHVRSIADIGSGAGFPGIPLAVVSPALSVYLIEPTKKKAVFLRHMAKVLGLQKIIVIEKRLEEIRDLKVDIAVSRALLSVEDAKEKAAGLIHSGGALILSKGPKILKELRDSLVSGITVHPLMLPFINITRYLVVVPIQKQSEAPVTP